MDFSSILLRNTRLMAVLRNLFALLVSVDVMYCQDAGKSYQTKTGTRRHVLPVIFETLGVDHLIFDEGVAGFLGC